MRAGKFASIYYSFLKFFHLGSQGASLDQNSAELPLKHLVTLHHTHFQLICNATQLARERWAHIGKDFTTDSCFITAKEDLKVRISLMTELQSLIKVKHFLF